MKQIGKQEMCATRGIIGFELGIKDKCRTLLGLQFDVGWWAAVRGLTHTNAMMVQQPLSFGFQNKKK